jgi:hypothetical protein
VEGVNFAFTIFVVVVVVPVVVAKFVNTIKEEVVVFIAKEVKFVHIRKKRYIVNNVMVKTYASLHGVKLYRVKNLIIIAFIVTFIYFPILSLFVITRLKKKMSFPVLLNIFLSIHGLLINQSVIP